MVSSYCHPIKQTIIFCCFGFLFFILLYGIGQAIIFLPGGFYLSSSSFNHSGCKLDVCTWCGLSANLECRSDMCRTQLSGNTGHKNDAKNRHLRTIAQLCRAVSLQLRHVSTIEKMLNSNMTSTCPYNMAKFCPLTSEICWRDWGTPANFNRFCVLLETVQVTPLRTLASSP